MCVCVKSLLSVNARYLLRGNYTLEGEAIVCRSFKKVSS